MSVVFLRTLVLLVALGLTACATRNPVIDTGGETYDGMVPVRYSGMKEAWVKPDINISSYQQVLLLPAEMQFRAVRPVAGPGLSRSTATEFPISPANQRRLVEMVTDVFREELARSKTLALTTEAGPDVLLVRISLLDIVSKVPPEGPGRTEIYLDEVGAATLVLELQDSMSGETLARAVDRRAAERPYGLAGPGTVARTTTVTAWSDVRRVARRWASAVTRRIDQLHAQGRTPG
ncbi:MAG: DUF3313 domain-containing protein [Gammaproteobacteria bacterium]|nr:DUF3313 domain-containing protein [Gammaproteobacteria bacterium]MDH5276470.1 DUF3313 domain-containing protein [Gammaproteobacteria bacterium]